MTNNNRSTKLENNHAHSLNPENQPAPNSGLKEETLSEKYASYKRHPDDYQQPNDLKEWLNRKSTGKELW
ncbi:hypothetical protein [Lentilactobacillus kisonensis]|uniref:Toxin-antitoxin system, antitoxin component, AbrB domain protein n=1 Tax=Lentilactobacillus kisonensis F0435 TaxID=797516 RepID=H1LI73_9LACO|nr:hypothetical protein [Lentilactobacillus kisonensis]EHO49906.1 toxin-antitoxin system, antitoxin component, AbrB domain protein [Lentilactobacillus kisonensis F0435]